MTITLNIGQVTVYVYATLKNKCTMLAYLQSL
jgi:hypothetical protein